MSGQSVVVASFILSSAVLTAMPALPAPPPATCIGAHCAAIQGGPAAPAAPIVVAATGIVGFGHPAVGVYCFYPAATTVRYPFVPLASVADDLTIPPVVSYGASFAEINFHAAKCPAPVPPAPFFVVEVDTFAAPSPVVGPLFIPVAPKPSDAVGFDVQF
jgi:hypothetical protein